jgi:aryl-alcohol dehydrogenase-like predicted oxidoreductase
MKLVVGSANFLNDYGFNKKKTTINQIKKIFTYCKTKSINEIDTSDTYDNFTKIEGLNFSNFKINTKITFDKKKIYKADYINSIIVKESSKLIHLNQRRYHSILIHNFYKFHTTKQLNRLNEIMNRFKNIGLTKYVGASIYSTQEIKNVEKCKVLNIIQLPYNLLDRTFNPKILGKLKKKNYLIYVRSVFLQGILLKNYDNLNKKFKKFKVLKKLQKWIVDNDLSRLDVMLSCIKMKKKYIDRVIVGIENLNHLKEINKSLKKKNEIFPNFIFSNYKNLIDPRKW